MIKCILINHMKNEFVPDVGDFNRWLSVLKYDGNAELNVKIATECEMRNFNKLYKNQDKISDTLAFPFENLILDKKVILGDIAMCAKKINNDSIKFNKEKTDRWAHLVIHSALHILGYKHDSEENQKNMENIEIDILKKLDILNPYEYI